MNTSLICGGKRVCELWCEQQYEIWELHTNMHKVNSKLLLMHSWFVKLFNLAVQNHNLRILLEDPAYR